MPAPTLAEGLALLDKYKHRTLTMPEAHVLLHWLDLTFLRSPSATPEDRGWAAMVWAGVWAVLIDQQVDAQRQEEPSS